MKEVSTGFTDPNKDPVREAQQFYSLFYTRYLEDSPEGSRKSILDRLIEIGGNLPCGARVLDLGSGVQVLESYSQMRELSRTLRVVTLDIAHITPGQLLAKEFDHVIASGTQMPFEEGSFSAVVSNMAIDFMPKETLSQLDYVLAPNGHVALNLHHPKLIPDDLDVRIFKYEKAMGYKKRPLKETEKLKGAALYHKRYLRNNAILYQNEGQIAQTFSAVGFEVLRVEEANGLHGPWWEVDLAKTGRRCF